VIFTQQNGDILKIKNGSNKTINTFVIEKKHDLTLALNEYICNPEIPRDGMNFDTLET
jgi:hypothetical protein